ncbi:MAG TPA: NAD-dependent epimerase/dehydratase family protein [Patescibacteria group bacterium]|nr:NAD-dependent epimerase/dehydratase family protein [Patescibacteria group bacterium]
MKIAITGAFGYSGHYIADRLLNEGNEVVTLTNSFARENPFGDRVKPFPFHFEEPELLGQTLNGVDVLINTYWVRFDHRQFSHDQAVQNTNILFRAAKAAGVRRIVHISITNPDINSDLPYFRGKAKLELGLRELGISFCILRPTVLFGKEDVLINNIAWSLRRLPVFGVFGDGEYRLQPIYVDDLAAAAVAKSSERNNEIIDATGPETFTYRELVDLIQCKVGTHRPVISVAPELGYWACRVLGLFLRDVIITREEIRGLMENRLCVQAPPLGKTRLSDWLAEHHKTLGRHYTSEMARRVDRVSSYGPN